MRYSTSILALATPLLVSARPLRTTRAASANTALVFNFANVLNQLENEFYTQALAKFTSADFDSAGFSTDIIPSQIFNAIQQDEAAHISTIQSTLSANGATPLNCSFDFSSVLTDVPTTTATSRLVEFLGVTAFQGGATLIDDPVLLDAAASILTVEARHSTLLNILSGTGSVIPQAFDLALTPQEVVSIAGPFITGPCDIGITPTNSLSITNSGPITSGTTLTVSGTNITGTDNLFCNLMTGGMTFAMNMPLSQCVVPPDVNGPVAVWITSDDDPLVNNVIDRATTQQVAGPAIFFVDPTPDAIVSLVRGGSSSGSSSSSDSSSGSSSNSSSSSSSGSNGAAAAPASTPLPPDYVGPSPDGHVMVNGVSSVPGTPAVASSTPASAASASASASATSSSS
jgi:uncharacterized membrane protein YgcG